jgi:hypothetical protein
MDLIWGKREGKYFCKWDWTGNLRDLLVRQNRLDLAYPSSQPSFRGAQSASPESITTDGKYGFRTAALRLPE